MPTLFTDPRSGGVKKSSGVNVLPIVQETWAEVRDDSNTEVDWLIAGYHGNSKTDITVLTKGHGGLSSCANVLPCDIPVFGGLRLSRGRFVTFFYADEGTSVMKKGRASMHKNGVLNVLQGSDCEIEIWPGMTEDDVGKSPQSSSLTSPSGIVTKGAKTNTDADTNVNSNTPSASFDITNVEETEGPTNNNDSGDDFTGGGSTGTRSDIMRSRNNIKYTSSNNGANESHQLDRKIKTLDINALGSSQERSMDTQNTAATSVKVQHKPFAFRDTKPSSSSSSPPLSLEAVDGNENEFSNEHRGIISDNIDEKEVAIGKTYVPYSKLKGISDVSELPAGVDPVNREASLSDEEFREVFGIEKESFYKLPSWKRMKQKKDKLLF